MTKKMTSAFAALIMAVALALGAAGSAFAADPTDGSIKVTGDQLAGKKVHAYKMFDVTGTGDAASYTLNPQFEGFFKSDAKYGCADKTGADLSSAAYAYVHGLGDDNAAAVTGFANEAQDWVKQQTTGVTPIEATADADGAATLGTLAHGYYLVYPDAGSTSVERKTDAMLVNVKDATPVEVALKSVYPTVDKAIVDAGGNLNADDVKIGDTVTFTLTAKVPDMSDYTAYTFKFHDTLSAGLTFGSITGVTIGGTAAAADTDYAVTAPAPAAPAVGGGELTVEIKNMKTRTAGQDIVVTYTATLNENAVTGLDPNMNKATVEYSNDPFDATGNKTGTSTEDIVDVHTFDFTVDKYTGTYGADAKRLVGATFELRATSDTTGEAINLVQVSAGNASTAAVYRIAKTGEADPATTFATPESGKVQIKGLAAGTYYLHETVAPAGYNKLAAPLKVEIAATYDATTGKLTAHTVKYGDASTASETGNVIPVQNNTGAVLPGTGGMGTIALTAGGVLLIVAGVAWMVVRGKRKNGDA